MIRGATLACLALAALAGCSAFPAEGPSAKQIERAGRDNAQPTMAPFVLIELTAERAAIIEDSSREPQTEDDAPLPSPRAHGLIGPGDALRITIWESDPAASILIDKAALDITARVEVDGSISVPFAGRIAASGRRPQAIEREIVSRLAGRALSPEASVAIADDQADTVVLQGEITRNGSLPLAMPHVRLLDAIALGGGSRLPPFQTLVRVSRGASAQSHLLSDVATDPGLDIEVSPGDRILLTSADRHFYAFGAVNRPGEQPFASERMSLARALGKIAGLQDSRADPRALFVFRHQPRHLTERLQPAPARTAADPTRVIYKLDLTDPGSFFVIHTLTVQPEDILYVSNAPSTDAAKFLQLVVGFGNVAGVPRDFGAY